MDAILADLSRLLLRALPTFLLLLVLHFYLKWMFFRPLDKVLDARRQATEGARQAAEASLHTADQKSADYESAVRAARGDIYKEQEESRRKWRAEQAAAVEQSRQSAAETIRQARAQIAEDAAQARLALAGESERLASRIAEAILSGRRH
jgi:F-type H+-transporting ATPase subunit b